MQQRGWSRLAGRRNNGLARGWRRAGMTLTETAMAMSVMLVALMSVSAANLRTSALGRQNHERAVAMNVVRSVADRIQAFSQQALEADPTTWSSALVAALSAGGAIGNKFDLAELTPQGAAGSVGSIQVVTDETVTDQTLNLTLGMPRDLDGDAQATNADVTGTARLLPVVINVDWSGPNGTVSLRHPILLLGY